MTGCGADEAEAMRRALGTDQGRREVETRVRVLMTERGHDERTVEDTWRLVAAFGNFGFCKAHAAAFALPTHQSAYLKRHFPAAFFAGVMSHDPGMYPRRVLLHDARRLGVPVLALDVNLSGRHWHVDTDAEGRWGLRPSLSDVGALTGAELDRLLTRRPFTDPRDLIARASLSRESVDNLVLAGALDSLAGVTGVPGAPDRRDVLVHAHALLRAHGVARGGRRVVASTADQLSLGTGPTEVPVRAGTGMGMGAGAGAAMTHDERVAEELRVLGYELSGHLLDRYAEHLAGLASAHDLVQAEDLHRIPDGARVMVAGVRVCTQTPPTRSGRRVVFTTVEDRTGLVDVALFEDAQRHSAASVFGSDLVVVHGRVRRAAPGALPTLTATRVRPLDGNAGVSSGKG